MSTIYEHTAGLKKNVGNIVLIEDDVDDFDLLAEAFREVSPKHSLICLTSADKLFAYLHSIPEEDLPCLFITDLNISIINGIAILNMLTENKRYAHIPKI